MCMCMLSMQARCLDFLARYVCHVVRLLHCFRVVGHVVNLVTWSNQITRPSIASQSAHEHYAAIRTLDRQA
jgi:hypothetical protein